MPQGQLGGEVCGSGQAAADTCRAAAAAATARGQPGIAGEFRCIALLGNASLPLSTITCVQHLVEELTHALMHCSFHGLQWKGASLADRSSQLGTRGV